MSTTQGDRGRESRIGRRDLLRGAVGVAGAGALAAASTGDVAAQPSFGGWMSDANNYDEVVDETGSDTVTVEVGAGSTGLAFAPAAVRVDPGTTIEWEWTGQGGGHNVHAQDGADFESDLYSEAGQHFSHTFEEEGVVTYQCDPHVGAGMKGVVVVGDVEVGGGPGGTADGGAAIPDFGGWLDDANGYEGGVTDLRGQDTVTVEVGAGSTGLAFGPAAVWIDPGTTIEWEWTGQGGGHNVHAQDGADFQSELYSEAGQHFSHTFEESGIVTYQCDPHAGVGMLAAVAVGDDVPTVQPGGGGDGDGGFALPTTGVGTALLGTTLGLTGLAAVLVLAVEAYGELHRERAPAEAEEAAYPEPDPDEGIVREIGHDEFDPTGTASLIVVYLLILVGMWIFMYFVEFLGNGPTVIG